jgi:hypothetical protein
MDGQTANPSGAKGVLEGEGGSNPEGNSIMEILQKLP